MWKWIGGILLVVIVLVMGAAWWGFRKISSGFEPDGSARVVIAATPSRVFSSLSDADSAATWMAGGSTVYTGKHGTLAPGDSVRISMRGVSGMSGQPVTWKITEVVPGQVIARQIESPDPKRKFTAVRRDSIAQVGDSTAVISKTTPTTALTETSAQMVLSMFRIQSKLELLSLKARLEGRSRSRPIP